uniref:Transcription factor bHLH121 n=2 Tax=Rhizophora mucronata TaxID=61149 RepID=A0A2P2MJI2_RHIMU
MQMQASNSPFIGFTQQPPPPDGSVPPTRPHPESRPEVEVKDSMAARKIQKADRERLRRDRLNEQFVELGNVLDPNRPKNDKATILSDTIQLLKDLTSQITKLKAEHAALTDESHELTQEKNDLREEKVSLKSDIENLNTQYQQRLRAMFPWTAMDHSVVVAPPSYPFPVPVAMPPGPIPMHPTMQPYPFFGNQNPTVLANPCSTFVPYVTQNTMVDQQSTQRISSFAQPRPVSQSHVSGNHDSRNTSSQDSKDEKSNASNDVTTDLELKTPGSASDQDLSSGQRKSRKSPRNESGVAEESFSSGCSSSCSVQDSLSNSMVSRTKAGDLEK